MTEKISVFSLESMTVLIESNRLINSTLQKTLGLSTTDYCILQQLFVENTKVETSFFEAFLSLKKNSLSIAITRLEKRTFIERVANKNDLRTYSIRITKKGITAAKEGSTAIRKTLSATVWRNNPHDEMINAMMKQFAVLYSKGDRREDGGFSSVQLEDEYFVIPGWVSAQKKMEQLWLEDLRSHNGLSLSEFRILAVVAEEKEQMRVTDIAKKLFLEKSAVSVVVKTLKDKGLVDSFVSKSDKRNTFIGLTEKGFQIEQEAYTRLATLNDERLPFVSKKEAERFTEWMQSMYDGFRLL